MSDLKAVFDAFYSRFILRDLFGKIAPGLVIIWALAACAGFPLSITRFALSKISLWGWLVLLALGWVAGFSIQGFGEVLGLAPTKPRRIPKECPGAGKKLSEKAFYKFWDEFERGVSEISKQDTIRAEVIRQTRERAVVIKEATGNGYLAVLISVMLLGIPNWIARGAPPLGPEVFGATALVVGLLIMNITARRREYRYMATYSQHDPTEEDKSGAVAVSPPK